MAIYAVINSENIVENMVNADTALESNFVLVAPGVDAAIGYSYDSATNTFTRFNEDPISEAENKAEAEKLLQESDWTQLDDVGLTGANKDEWIAYRASLRAIALNPGTGLQNWPDKPDEEYS